jgi:hypothetical protein
MEVAAAPRTQRLKTESAVHLPGIDANPYRTAKKRDSPGDSISRRGALTQLSVSFAAKQGAPPVGLEPTTRRLTHFGVRLA